MLRIGLPLVFALTLAGASVDPLQRFDTCFTGEVLQLLNRFGAEMGVVDAAL
jgi:hypothetical protein